MRGKDVRRDHGEACVGFSAAGRAIGRRLLGAISLCVAGAMVGVGLLGEVAHGAPGSVRLPTEADALAYAPNSETILFGALGVETRLPGPVDDREQVSVGLALDGSITKVRVAQRLTITGVGDFSFKVPGPARDVRSLPESASTPGLRKGALLWQGFAAGRK